MKVKIKKIFLLIILIMVCSCHFSYKPQISEFEKLDFFKDVYASIFASTYQVEILNYHLVNNPESKKHLNKLLDKWVPIIQLDSLTSTDFWSQRYCLFLRKNEFKISKIDFKTNCAQFNHLISKDKPFHLKKINNFELHITNDKIAQINQKKILPFHFYFNFEFLQKKYEILFPFYNVPKGRIRINPRNTNLRAITQTTPYSSSHIERLIPGVMILGLKDKNQDQKAGSLFSNLKGKEGVNNTNNSLIKCHEMGSRCEVIMPYSCDECRYGFFESVGPCPYVTTKFCGIDSCGKRNSPPCPKGQVMNKVPTKFCKDLELTSFCREGLIPVCDSKGNPICK